MRRAYLLILKLNQAGLVHHDFIPLVHALLEQLREGEPLPSHLVAVVRIDKLVIVNTVGCVAFYTLDGGLAGVESDNIVNQSLACWRQLDALAWVGSIVLRCGSLADLELLAGC